MMNRKWRTLALGEIVKMNSGGTPSRAVDSYWNGDIPWYSGKDLKTLFLRDSIEHITPAAIGRGARLSSAGTMLILVRGMTLMKEVPVGVLSRASAFNQDVKALALKDASLDIRYIAYFLRADNARLRNLVTTAGHGTGRLPIEALEGYPIPLPPLPEQRKIADILTTWDKALEKLDALIAAKERRKKAIMQQLLIRSSFSMGTTHARHRLGDVFERVTRRNLVGDKNVLTISARDGLVSQRDYFNRSVAGADLSNYYLLKNGEYAYNRSSSNGYPFGALKRLDAYDTGVVSTLYLCFRIKDDAKVSSNYLCQYFESGNLNTGLRSIAKEGARAHGLLNVTADEFFELDAFLPPVSVQLQIAAILDACDKDLRLLRDQRGALDQQKRGLMQRLLTGRVRVKS